MQIGELTLEDAVQKAAGNWRSFDSFAWFRKSELDDPDKWAVIYTHHRDSGLLDQSNAAVIEKALGRFARGIHPSVVFESHSHFAVGHVDGFSVKVYDKRGQITKAFAAYHELAERMAAYPVLDEEDYSSREYDATMENIADSAWRIKNDFELPDDWESEVYSWFADNLCGEIENRDDKGAYPSESAMLEAFDALRFKQVTLA